MKFWKALAKRESKRWQPLVMAWLAIRHRAGDGLGGSDEFYLKLRSARNENREKKKGKNMSATETKKATAATSETIAELFLEAMRSYEKALKSGILLQEESVNLWKELLTKLGSPEELQAKLESMTADAFPKARKRMEEFVETFNRTSNQTIDLFEKTLGVYQATSVPDAQRRMQDLVESSLTTLRINVHSALNTNAKIIASWKELWTFQPGRKVITQC